MLSVSNLNNLKNSHARHFKQKIFELTTYKLKIKHKRIVIN